MLYFAYWSNLHHFQMKRRCKDSIFLKKINLKDFRLTFRSKYRAADIEPKKNSIVFQCSPTPVEKCTWAMYETTVLEIAWLVIVDSLGSMSSSRWDTIHSGCLQKMRPRKLVDIHTMSHGQISKAFEAIWKEWASPMIGEGNWRRVIRLTTDGTSGYF